MLLKFNHLYWIYINVNSENDAVGYFLTHRYKQVALYSGLVLKFEIIIWSKNDLQLIQIKKLNCRNYSIRQRLKFLWTRLTGNCEIFLMGRPTPGPREANRNTKYVTWRKKIIAWKKIESAFGGILNTFFHWNLIQILKTFLRCVFGSCLINYSPSLLRKLIWRRMRPVGGKEGQPI